jgi:hypothetical protein
MGKGAVKVVETVFLQLLLSATTTVKLPAPKPVMQAVAGSAGVQE